MDVNKWVPTNLWYRHAGINGRMMASVVQFRGKRTDEQGAQSWAAGTRSFTNPFLKLEKFMPELFLKYLLK